MTGSIKTAFAGITAEESLKERTLQYLHGEIKRRTVKKTRTAVRRLAVCAASFAILICLGVFSHNLYYTASAYVDMDVNPSVELAINRFNRVIDAYSYNQDGRELLSGLKLTHKRYDTALTLLLDALGEKGYMSESSSVSVTLQTDDETIEKQLLPELQAGVTAAAHHHGSAQVDVFPVDHETRDISHQYNISPAKYLALLELMEVDPTATIEGCKHHSINEIKQQAHSHSQSHHGGGHSANNQTEETDEPEKQAEETAESENQDEPGKQHDGKDQSETDTHPDTSETDTQSDTNQGHGKNKGGQHHGGNHN